MSCVIISLRPSLKRVPLPQTSSNLPLPIYVQGRIYLPNITFITVRPKIATLHCITPPLSPTQQPSPAQSYITSQRGLPFPSTSRISRNPLPHLSYPYRGIAHISTALPSSRRPGYHFPACLKALIARPSYIAHKWMLYRYSSLPHLLSMP
jgi:hypothetical protein